MGKKPGHQPRKRFGQNFLHDGTVIERIVKAIAPQPGQYLVEIGPGLGALTQPLIDSGANLTAVELDRDLIPVLRTKFFNADNFRIFEADALRFDYASLLDGGNGDTRKQLRLVGNLPYNISTPLIFHLLETTSVVADMHFMLQKEVVDRLAAHPGDSQYGRLSIMAQYYCEIKPVFNVGPGAFNPPPKVWSAIVRLQPYERPPVPARDVRILSRVVAQAFSMRRKTLRNSLRQYLSEDQLTALKIDPQARPENLGLLEFVRVADYIAELDPTQP